MYSYAIFLQYWLRKTGKFTLFILLKEQSNYYVSPVFAGSRSGEIDSEGPISATLNH